MNLKQSNDHDQKSELPSKFSQAHKSNLLSVMIMEAKADKKIPGKSASKLALVFAAGALFSLMLILIAGGGFIFLSNYSSENVETQNASDEQGSSTGDVVNNQDAAVEDTPGEKNASGKGDTDTKIEAEGDGFPANPEDYGDGVEVITGVISTDIGPDVEIAFDLPAGLSGGVKDNIATIKGGSFELNILGVYADQRTSYRDMRMVEDAEIDGLFSYVFEDEINDKIYRYSNEPTPNDGSCEFIGGPISSLDPPCGWQFIHPEDSGWLNAKCIGDLGACNTIMSTLRIIE